MNTEKYANWLTFIAPNYNWIEFFKLDAPAKPVDIANNDELLELISFLWNNKIIMQPVFYSNAWYNYLRDISEHQVDDAFNLLQQIGSPADLLFYLRAMYRFGSPVVNDTDYDAIEKLYIYSFSFLSYVANLTYDDDDEYYSDLVKDLLKMTLHTEKGKRLKDIVKQNKDISPEKKQLFDELNSEKSKSIKPIESWEEVYSFVVNAKCDIHLSLKIDGINTKCVFSDKGEGLLLALSRGRASTSYDYTEAIKKQIELHNIDEHLISGKLTGESFVTLEGIKYLNKKYPDKEYKTPKSTGAAMLRSPQNFDDNDLSYLRTIFFSYNDERADTAFNKLSNIGLDVPFNKIVKFEDIPKTYENFKTWLFDDILTPFFNQSCNLGIITDGVVLTLLDDIEDDNDDKFGTNNIAIKFGPWSAQSYKSKVTDILVEQQKSEASIVLQIEPTITADFNTATRVGGISSAILIQDNVRIGDTIEFERKSAAYNTYKCRLE